MVDGPSGGQAPQHWALRRGLGSTDGGVGGAGDEISSQMCVLVLCNLADRVELWAPYCESKRSPRSSSYIHGPR